MKLTRPKRIALELLGPPFVGALLWNALLASTTLWESAAKGVSWDLLRSAFEMAAVILVVAYFVAGLQSIVCTLIMEWRFARGLDARSWRMVGWFSLLGLASGAVLVPILGNVESKQIGPWLILGGNGLVVGFLMGLLIKRWSVEKDVAGEDSI